MLWRGFSECNRLVRFTGYALYGAFMINVSLFGVWFEAINTCLSGIHNFLSTFLFLISNKMIVQNI